MKYTFQHLKGLILAQPVASTVVAAGVVGATIIATPFVQTLLTSETNPIVSFPTDAKDLSDYGWNNTAYYNTQRAQLTYVLNEVMALNRLSENSMTELDELSVSTFITEQLETYSSTQTLYAFTSGSGRANDPYLISSPAELHYLRQQVNKGNKMSGIHFKLVADIDLSGFDSDSNPNNGNWEPIGQGSTVFSGYFHGNGHVVKGMTIENTYWMMGLFGHVRDGVVEKLGLENAIAKTTIAYPHALLVAQLSGRMAQVNESYATGTLVINTGGAYAGGIVGNLINNASVRDVYFNGILDGNTLSAGGLVGYMSTETSLQNGYVVLNSNDLSYSKGAVIGSRTSGSIIHGVYYLRNTVTEGLNGALSGSSLGIEAISGDDLRCQRPLVTLPEFNFSTKWKISNGHPVLNWEKVSAPNETCYASGDGSSVNPYLITTPAEFDYLRYQVNVEQKDTSGRYYALGSDLDMSAFDSDRLSENGNWEPIGTTSTAFKGIFDGRGHQLEHLTLLKSTTACVGVFGYINQATIQSLALTTVYVEGNYNVGTLVGCAQQSQLTHNSVTGRIQSGSISGGVGGQLSNTSVSNHYSNVEITAQNGSVGGIAGLTTGGTFSQNLVVGTIDGSASLVMPIVGSESSSTFQSNYWDETRFARATTESMLRQGNGKETRELILDKAVRTLVGFSFDSDWHMTNEYPKLTIHCAGDYYYGSLKSAVKTLFVTVQDILDGAVSGTLTLTKNGETVLNQIPFTTHATLSFSCEEAGSYAMTIQATNRAGATRSASATFDVACR